MSINNNQRPDIPRRLFWDWRYDKIDWQAGYISIIDRVIERGTQEEWEEMIRFYSHEKVVNALKNEIKYLPDYIIPKVCSYFDLKPEQLACWERKKTRRGHWI